MESFYIVMCGPRIFEKRRTVGEYFNAHAQNASVIYGIGVWILYPESCDPGAYAV